MTYDLYIGDSTFSSWSLRGWLLLEKFGLDFNTHLIGLYRGTMAADMAHLAPAKLVPTLRIPDGAVVGESLAIAETLAEHHPDITMWPTNPAARATARWLCAKMASSFGELRRQSPMQLQHVNKGFNVNAALQADLDRLEILWAHGAKFKSDGPWLFGEYSIADYMFAPVAARIIGYDLPISAAARAHCTLTINDPPFKAWRAEGLKTT
ncbi:MAG: glutathione S-transferase [Ascidiaceihabitans sp.]|jgi:glutathione S-transferase